jgi:hypothetical protein
MKKFVMFGIFIVFACGDLMPIRQTYIAPELIEGSVISYVDEFYNICPNAKRVRFVALVSRLPSDAKDTAVARTTLTSESGEGMVFIKLDKFLAWNDNQRRWVVFHELVHASLGLNHFGEGFMKGDGSSHQKAGEFKVEDLSILCQ